MDRELDEWTKKIIDLISEIDNDELHDIFLSWLNLRTE